MKHCGRCIGNLLEMVRIDLSPFRYVFIRAYTEYWGGYATNTARQRPARLRK